MQKVVNDLFGVRVRELLLSFGCVGCLGVLESFEPVQRVHTLLNPLEVCL